MSRRVDLQQLAAAVKKGAKQPQTLRLEFSFGVFL
jgi:hypothetical protein